METIHTNKWICITKTADGPNENTKSLIFQLQCYNGLILAKRRKVCEYDAQFYVSIFDMSPFSSALKWCFPLNFKLCLLFFFFFFIQKININNSRIPLVLDQMNIQFQVGLLKKTTKKNPPSSGHLGSPGR